MIKRIPAADNTISSTGLNVNASMNYSVVFTLTKVRIFSIVLSF